MLFKVIGAGERPASASSQAYLCRDRWDDWGKYQTQFYLIVFDENGEMHEAGNVKIGQFGLAPSPTIEPGKRAPAIPEDFDILDESFFSLGQNETYYETLNLLTPELRLRILQALKDVAFNLELFEKASDQYVMGESLMRSLRSEMIRNRFHRLALGDATLTEFRFKYTLPESNIHIDGYSPPSIDFIVTPNSAPPTNVHVLIGRNGVGKSTCMQNLARTVLGVENAGRIDPLPRPLPGLFPGLFRQLNDDSWAFSGLVSVSFSAFDNFDLPAPRTTGIRADSIGLRAFRSAASNNDNGNLSEDLPHEFDVVIKTPQALANDFVTSFDICRSGLRRERWSRAVNTLSNDPLFAEANPLSLLEIDDGWRQVANHFFDRLSSGHKIVLLTITRLVELVDERTLVLLDEPEGHLHPPLLSAFIRSLADLLIQRNGVAIIATHSPVVLQEVPRSCVWTLERAGIQSKVERPRIETFGENVGVLTREVFGLEVTTAGFHELLHKAINEQLLDYTGLLQYFNNQLGAEGKAIAQAMLIERAHRHDA